MGDIRKKGVGWGFTEEGGGGAVIEEIGVAMGCHNRSVSTPYLRYVTCLASPLHPGTTFCTLLIFPALKNKGTGPIWANLPPPTRPTQLPPPPLTPYSIFTRLVTYGRGFLGWQVMNVCGVKGSRGGRNGVSRSVKTGDGCVLQRSKESLVVPSLTPRHELLLRSSVPTHR
jgi:hypothetical protein